MNRCDDVLELLSLFLDDELDASRRAAMQVHLRGCPDCRAELQSMSDLKTSFSGAFAPPEVSQAEWEGVALRAVSSTSRRLGEIVFWPGVAAIAVFAFAAFLTDPEVPVWVRFAVAMTAAGITFMTLAAVLDRLRARRGERYERIER